MTAARRALAALAVSVSLGLSLGWSAAAAAAPKAPVPAKATVAADEARAARASPLVLVADGRMLAPDIARVVNQGELVVAMLASDTAPFFSVNKDGVLVGSEVELARRIGQELGVPVRFDRNPKSFDAVSELVASGGADMGISRMARTLKRAQIVQFSEPYARLGHALLINRMRFAAMAGDQPLPQVVRNFGGSLGVIGNSAWEEFGRRNFPQAKLVPYPTWKLVVEAVKKGDVVAAYRDELEVMQIVRGDPSLALSLRTVTFDDVESVQRIMVGIRDTTLLSFINEVIAQWVVKPVVGNVPKPTR